MNLTSIAKLLENMADCEITIHTINRNFQKTLGVYPRRGATPYSPEIGDLQGFDLMPVTLILRWGRNGVEAEEMAKKLYISLENASLERGILIHTNNAPIWLGADERGVFEYALDVDFFIKK